MSNAVESDDPDKPARESSEGTTVSHEMLDWMRINVPAFFDADNGSYVLTRHSDVRNYLGEAHSKNPDLAEPGTFLETAGKPINPYRPDDAIGMGYLDDPEHHRVRTLFALALHKQIANARPLVERIVHEHLDELSNRNQFDVVADFAIPIPLQTIAYLIGMQEEDLPQFRAWALAGFKSFKPNRTAEESRALDQAQEGFACYLEEAMAKRRKAPKNDLLSDMLRIQSEGGDITDSEIRVNCMSIAMAAMMSTTDLIGSGIWLFLTHPLELAKLKADSALIRPAVEEILRLESPVEFEWRVASRDLEISNCPVKRGQVVTVSLNGANRDPEVFENPHAFDISRAGRPHLAFGGGAHICIGAALGRLEGQIAIASFFERFPDMRLKFPTTPPKWRDLPFFHGLDELLVCR